MQSRSKIRERVLPIVLMVISVIIIVSTAIISSSRGDDVESSVQRMAREEVTRLVGLVKQREKVIETLMSEVSMRDSLIIALESRRTFITNKYYYNEKEILNSNDSVNHAMRLVNQSAFESDYFGGKYAPSK